MTSLIPYGRGSLPNTTVQPGMPASVEATKYIVANLVYPVLQTFTGGQAVSEEEMAGLVAIWAEVLVGFAPEAYPLAARMIVIERTDRWRPVPAEVREYLERAEAKVLGRPDRRRFASDHRLPTIAFNRLTGAHGNMILDAVPEASREDVETGMVEISDAFQAKGVRYARDNDDVPIKRVIDKAIEHLRKKLLYRIYGEPEKQVVGVVAARSTWCVITKDRVEQWLSEYPEAFYDDGAPITTAHSAFRADHFLSLVLADMQNPHERYGRGLQQEVEAALGEKIRQAHHNRVEKREWIRRQAEEDRKESEERRRDLRRGLLAKERAREKLGITPGDYTRLDSPYSIQLERIEYDLLKQEEMKAPVEEAAA